jgi:beta-mannosidase
MPRWPDHDAHEVTRLDGFAPAEGGPPSDALERTFHLTFRSSPAAPGEQVVLALDGIATVFTVLLNGVEIVSGRSMFVGHEADVGDLLLDGDNELVIHCRALDDVLADVPRGPRQRWRTKVVANGGALRFVRTAILGRAPGFAPGPPIVGPWRAVWLVRRRGPSLRAVTLRPRVDGEDGVLELAGHVADAGTVRVEVAGAVTEAEVAADGSFGAHVWIPGVERWWPHTHGEPVLHDVRVILDDAVVVAAGRVGFRTLAPGPHFDADRDDLALAVNEVPVFARGAVWTPVPEDERRATLEAARDAGLNLVRLAGIGVYEDEAFHDLCDELGLLVWQDFMFANLDYPIEDAGFRADVEAEAREALARVAGRPSLAVVCGNSEVEQQAAMYGADSALARGELFGALLPRLVREAGVDAPYLPSAPCGGALPFHPGTGVTNYFGVGGYRRPLEDARHAGVRFASECLALANVPDAEVPRHEGVIRDVGADWDFADVRDHYLDLLHRTGAANLHDNEPERYRALSRAVSGEVMAATFGEWRRAASPCAGAIVLWLRDLAPGSGWGLLDHAGAPKLALAHLRAVLAPRALWLTGEGLNGVDVHVANDGPEPLHATLEVALLASGAHAVAEGTATLEVAAHTTIARNVEAVLRRFADASYAYRFGPAQHDTVVATLRDAHGALLAQACHFPLGRPTTPVADLGLRATLGPAHPSDPLRCTVALSTERLAYGVRVRADGARPDHDGFVVVPGTPRTVTLRASGDAPPGPVSVTALNLTGEAPVGYAN